MGPITPLAFVLALLCAGVMGFAIQRGGTCTVAAVEEIVDQRSARRLLALAEASLWVTGGLLLARALDMLPAMPEGFALDRWTLAGGALLGLGAWVNRACVFGTVARLGSGEWSFALTPLGFYLGCLSVRPLFGTAPHHPLAGGSPVLASPAWAVLPFLVFAAWRLLAPLRRARTRRALAECLWSPHAATTVIGISFVLMLLVAGAWAYTEVLAELARGMAAGIGARTALLAALLLGAIWGGRGVRRLRGGTIAPAQGLRRLAGGWLMGWGSLLIPGGNDGLILVGMPLLWPYAWAAFGLMCLSIGAALLTSRHLPIPHMLRALRAARMKP
ncbi:YeeE/YedE thiosulfate transporter family protein [Variovorax defluvii]|uniref:YeeE/YedE thiosulfate transporter family protein n=1 Tax=Variovorax defluvii TaxID=913761 RepID=A0ABP8HTY4_9BURK